VGRAIRHGRPGESREREKRDGGCKSLRHRNSSRWKSICRVWRKIAGTQAEAAPSDAFVMRRGELKNGCNKHRACPHPGRLTTTRPSPAPQEREDKRKRPGLRQARSFS
jgi:hypothetical protein